MRPSLMTSLSAGLIALSALADHASAGILGGSATAISDVAEKVSPAVVSITTEGERVRFDPRGEMQNLPPGFFFGPQGPRGGGPEQAPMGVASGVIISSDGYVVTNNHVVAHAQKVVVKLSDQRALVAKVIGTDESADLALVKVEAKDLPHLEMGDSQKLRLGEIVLAVGNPFGVGQTVTMGIVSAKGRSHVGIVDYEDFIQTDAAINPGNSGGALVNLEGELVGINTAILSRSGGAQGVGLAVPSAMVQPIVAQLKTSGKVTRGWLGVAIQDLTPEIKEALKLEANSGALISDVLENGPAKKAGVESGDVVVRLDGQPVESASALRNAIGLMSPGRSATLAIMRGGKSENVKVTLETRDAKGTVGGAAPTRIEGPLAGVQLEPLTKEVRRELDVPDRIAGGVLVAAVDADSAAARAGLKSGDLIIGLGNEPVTSNGNLAERLLNRDVAVLRVWREGSAVFIVIRS